jgi:hypothetical protein
VKLLLEARRALGTNDLVYAAANQAARNLASRVAGQHHQGLMMSTEPAVPDVTANGQMTAEAGQVTEPGPQTPPRRIRGHGQKATRKRDLLITNLLTSSTYAEAAQKTGISECTLYRWLRDPDFQSAFRQARRQIVDHAVSRLTTLTSKAVTTLERNMHSSVPSSEVRSALGVLDHVKTLLLSEEQDERLTRLEELVEARISALERMVQGNHRC